MRRPGLPDYALNSQKTYRESLATIRSEGTEQTTATFMPRGAYADIEEKFNSFYAKSEKRLPTHEEVDVEELARMTTPKMSKDTRNKDFVTFHQRKRSCFGLMSLLAIMSIIVFGIYWSLRKPTVDLVPISLDFCHDFNLSDNNIIENILDRDVLTISENPNTLIWEDNELKCLPNGVERALDIFFDTSDKIPTPRDFTFDSCRIRLPNLKKIGNSSLNSSLLTICESIIFQLDSLEVFPEGLFEAFVTTRLISIENFPVTLFEGNIFGTNVGLKQIDLELHNLIEVPIFLKEQTELEQLGFFDCFSLTNFEKDIFSGMQSSFVLKLFETALAVRPLEDLAQDMGVNISNIEIELGNCS